MIYLDYNATAPLRPAARDAWLRAQDTVWANPGSRHQPGQAARHALDQVKCSPPAADVINQPALAL